MNPKTKELILSATGAKEITGTELIQKLWNDYGDLLRLRFDDGTSAILKHVKLPTTPTHPKGFNTDLSRDRKVRSYQVETNWYENFNQSNLKDHGSPTAHLIKGFQTDKEFFILLEDLDEIGYSKRLTRVSLDEVKLVLSWLASFHAKFLQVKPLGLWQSGTYWHLETRPDELAALNDLQLKKAAPLINQRLKRARYQTLVHGDAKLANFCFSENSKKVAAVDFQYCGGGCGMKDVAYFIGGCLDAGECEKFEGELLDFYFDQLLKNIKSSSVDKNELEIEWRDLYHTACADFHRFLKGWSPGHWKINSYSEKVSINVLDSIAGELVGTAQEACLQAGKLVKSFWQKKYEVGSKDGSSLASSIVTEVDYLSQEKILSILRPSIEKYDFGLLAEESEDDLSRLSKEFFWAIDPLDGTLCFSEGQGGFAITIVLIDRGGMPFLGVATTRSATGFTMLCKTEDL